MIIQGRSKTGEGFYAEVRKDKGGHYSIRVDDKSNPSFWIMIHFTIADLERLTKSGEVVSQN